MKPARLLVAAAALASAVMASPVAAAPPRYLETAPGARPRVVVTTDPELDDSNSLIRFLLYSPDFRIEGLVYASSQFHWKGDGSGRTMNRPDRQYSRHGLQLCPCTSWRWDRDNRFIDDAVDAYASAWRNLRVHDRRYPSPEWLRARIRWGNVAFDADMSQDTAGSDLIRALLLDGEETPVHLLAWGGQSTIARALKSIEERHAGTAGWPAIRAKVIRKAVIHPMMDQDGTHAAYIKPHWPEIRYQEVGGGVPLGYNEFAGLNPADAAYFSAEWTRANVSTQGPLGAHYYVWGDGRQMAKGDIFDYFGEHGLTIQQLRGKGYVVWTPPLPKGTFVSEGDTPTFLNLVGNGLDGWRGPRPGGWGGTLQQGFPPEMIAMYEELQKLPADVVAEGLARRGVTLSTPGAPANRFVAPAQNDFAARLRWGVTPRRGDANHHPRITAAGPTMLTARPGERVALRVRASDPDGDAVTVRWWPWPEVGSYVGSNRGAVMLDRDAGKASGFTVPADARAGDEFDVVAEATDAGTPPLTRYERFTVSVR